VKIVSGTYIITSSSFGFDSEMADNNHIQADRYRRSVKSCDDKLTRCVNNLDMRLSRELRSSNDMARRYERSAQRVRVAVD